MGNLRLVNASFIGFGRGCQLFHVIFSTCAIVKIVGIYRQTCWKHAAIYKDLSVRADPELRVWGLAWHIAASMIAAT
jgi:undecaprenyl pyrophosphate phosphatase UppP